LVGVVLRYLGWSVGVVHRVAHLMGWPTRWGITLHGKEQQVFDGQCRAFIMMVALLFPTHVPSCVVVYRQQPMRHSVVSLSVIVALSLAIVGFLAPRKGNVAPLQSRVFPSSCSACRGTGFIHGVGLAAGRSFGRHCVESSNA
jgi:hypothetical protein